jgi:hypothetical protein
MLKKRNIATGFALSAAAFLSACGVRGDLDRPPPIFSSEPPGEEAQTPVDTTIAVAEAPEKPADEAYYNELGGEIPKTDPVDDIDESGMDEVGPG